MRTEDGHIICKCLAGEPEAFGFLVDKYKGAVYAFAYAKLHNFHDAEDVTQEVFIKAYQKLRTLRRWDNFRAWIYSITSNLCRNWIRARENRPDGEFIEDHDSEILTRESESSYREGLMSGSLYALLRESLDSLPEGYRQVLTFYYLGGMSSYEIAEFLGTSPSNVRLRLSRARSRLKEDMVAMMSNTLEAQRLPATFTFRIVEAVKRINISPMPRANGLPWGISLAAGIILAVLSIGSNLNLTSFTLSDMKPEYKSEAEISEVGEMPVEMLRTSLIPISSLGRQGYSYGSGFQTPDQQNAVLMAPRGEGEKWPEEPAARLGKGYVYGTAYSPDGKLFAVATRYGVWLHNAEDLSEVELSESGAFSVAFSPDGSILASGGDLTIQLWNVRDQEQIGELQGHTGAVMSLAFSSDGRILASGGDSLDKTVRLWDFQGQNQIGVLRGHKGAVMSLAFSSDGKMLASGSGYEQEKEDRAIFLWDVAEQKQVGLLQGHTKDMVESLAFSPDRKTLASGSWDTARLWDVQEQKQVGGLQGTNCHVFSDPDGGLLTIIFRDNAVRLWDIQEERELGILQECQDLEHFPILSPDGRTLALLGDGMIQFWDVIEQRQSGLLQGYSTQGVQSIAFSPDGKILASHDYYRTISLWDVQGQKQLAILKEDINIQVSNGFRFVAFSSDGRTLASGSAINNTIWLWDAQRQEQIGLLKGHTDGIWSLAFSPDGTILASGGGRGGDSTVRLWDVREQKEIKVLRGHSAHVHSLAFSPDGELLASGAGIDNTVRLWDTQEWNLVDVLQHARVVMSIAVSPDSKILASGDMGGTVHLWDIGGKPRLLIDLGGHTNCVRSLAFSPDGRWLASGSYDGTVRIWDVAERVEVAILKGHIYSVYSVAFSPDGKWLASGSADCTILLWEVNIPVQSKSVEPTGKLPGTWGKVKQTELYQNYPNPFNPETWIPFRLAQDTDVNFRIYNMAGRIVREIELGHRQAGVYTGKDEAAYWDGKNEAGELAVSGIYFYSMGTSDLRKMVMIR